METRQHHGVPECTLEDTSIGALYRSISSGDWKIRASHERRGTMNLSEKQQLIKRIGEIHFSPQITWQYSESVADRVIVYGGEEVGAICEYIEGQFPVDDVLFTSRPASDQKRFRNQTIAIRVYQGYLTREQVYSLYQAKHATKPMSIGENINAKDTPFVGKLRKIATQMNLDVSLRSTRMNEMEYLVRGLKLIRENSSDVCKIDKLLKFVDEANDHTLDSVCPTNLEIRLLYDLANIVKVSSGAYTNCPCVYVVLLSFLLRAIGSLFHAERGFQIELRCIPKKNWHEMRTRRAFLLRPGYLASVHRGEWESAKSNHVEVTQRLGILERDYEQYRTTCADESRSSGKKRSRDHKRKHASKKARSD